MAQLAHMAAGSIERCKTFRQGLMVACLLLGVGPGAGAMSTTLEDILAQPDTSFDGWRDRLGGSFEVTLVADEVDRSGLEYYGMSIFIYNLDAGHFGDHTRNIWSREDYANGVLATGAERSINVPGAWRDFSFGILLATRDEGVVISLSPDPFFFHVYQGNDMASALEVDGRSLRWDPNSYLIAIDTEGAMGLGSERLILHVAVPDSGIGLWGAAMTFLGLVGVWRIKARRARDWEADAA